MIDARLKARMDAAEAQLKGIEGVEPLRRSLVVERSGAEVRLRECPDGYQGLRWDGPPGGEGIRWSAGQEYLEHHPDLRPFWARGVAGSVGVWSKLALMPPSRAAFWAILAPITSAPWSLQEPEGEEGEEPAEAAVRARHWRYCQALWRRWTRPGGEYPLQLFFEHLLRYAVFEAGFYLGEAVALRQDFIRGVGIVPIFGLPALRRPASVREWVLSGEEPVGVVQELQQFTDSYGQSGESRVLLPWSRLLHVAHRPAGRTDLEGQSILRGAYPILEALGLLYQLQPLAVEVNALGTVWIEQDKDRPFTRGIDGSGDGELEVLSSHLENYKGEHVPYGILPPGGKVVRDTASDGVMDFSPIVAWLERQAYLAMGGEHLLVAVQQHGSYAAKDSASGDARDSLDYYASFCARALERYLCVCLRLAFPNEEPHTPSLVYAQVEERDNGAYLEQLATYLRDVRPLLDASNAQRLDEMLDLTTGETSESNTSDLTLGLAEGDGLDVPAAVRENARRGLELRQKHGRGGTAVGWARARDLANGRVSLDTVKRMVSYFDRHEIDKQGEGWGEDSAGYIAWLLWGGDAGWSWARQVVREADAQSS